MGGCNLSWRRCRTPECLARAGKSTKAQFDPDCRTRRRINEEYAWLWHPRLVALDIDGTLIGHDGRLPRSVFDAVPRVLRPGVPVVLSTGRGWIGTKPLAEALRLPPGQHVSSNGAVRVSYPPLEVLERVTFDPADVVERVLAVHPEAMLASRSSAAASKSTGRSPRVN